MELIKRKCQTPETINIELSGAHENSINKLNYDCLTKVFNYIPAVERMQMKNVCRKWEEAVASSWYTVKNVTINHFIPTHNEIKMLENCFQYVTHLTIDDFHEKILQIITSMPKLVYLNVRMNAMRTRTQIFNRLPSNVKEIHIARTIDYCDDLEKYLDDLPNRFDDLQRLTFQGYNLTDYTLQSILPNRNSLVYLDLSNCKFNKSRSSFFSNLNNLEHLSLNKVKNLNADVMIKIAQNCPKLKYFDFVISDQNYTHLDEIIPYPIFRELKNLKNLVHLQTSRVDKYLNDFENLMCNISNQGELKYLNIGHGYQFLESDIEEIKKFKKLEHLYLQSAKPIVQIIDIVDNCLELKTFDIEFGKASEEALEKLANLKKLEKLNLSWINKLSGDLLTKIASNCKNLIELNICACKNVTEASLLEVGKLKYLEILDISYIKNVPNVMFNDFRNLKYLTCASCPSVTDEGIIKVIDNCRNLVQLDVRNTGVTAKIFDHKSANPRDVSQKLKICTSKSLDFD